MGTMFDNWCGFQAQRDGEEGRQAEGLGWRQRWEERRVGGGWRQVEKGRL